MFGDFLCIVYLLCSTLYHRSILRILVHIRNIDLKSKERETRTGNVAENNKNRDFQENRLEYMARL